MELSTSIHLPQSQLALALTEHIQGEHSWGKSVLQKQRIVGAWKGINET